MDLVCCEGVPDDEFSVLGGGDEVAFVGGPVHGVDFGEVAFEGAADFHDDAGEGFEFGGDGFDWVGVLKIQVVKLDGKYGDKEGERHLRVVSASASFFCLILSFNASASFRAAEILSAMSPIFYMKRTVASI